MKVLVTGGGGFTGMVVVNRLLARGDTDVAVFDVRLPGKLEDLDKVLLDPGGRFPDSDDDDNVWPRG